jgi:CheY-like chemotaxis protein
MNPNCSHAHDLPPSADDWPTRNRSSDTGFNIKGRGVSRVLVIDDDAAIRHSVEFLLTEAGLEVFTAANGSDGLRRYADVKPDLVITDILMPVMEGIETVGHLRRLDPVLPILAMSGGWSGPCCGCGPSPLDLVAKLGATEVLPKPFSYDALLLAIAKCLPDEVNGPPSALTLSMAG